MKWFLFALLLLLSGAAAKPPCIVSDFYGISAINEPALRHQQLSMWLTTNGNNCNTEKLLIIWNNLAMWAGTADSSEIRAKILFYYAKAVEREK